MAHGASVTLFMVLKLVVVISFVHYNVPRGPSAAGSAGGRKDGEVLGELGNGSDEVLEDLVEITRVLGLGIVLPLAKQGHVVGQHLLDGVGSVRSVVPWLAAGTGLVVGESDGLGELGHPYSVGIIAVFPCFLSRYVCNIIGRFSWKLVVCPVDDPICAVRKFFEGYVLQLLEFEELA